MARRYTTSKAIDYICDHHTGEEERGQETDSEDGLEEEVSQDEDDTEYNPDQELSDRAEFSDEEDGHAKADVTFRSKNGNLFWSSSPPENQGRLSAENVIRMTPGPTKYAVSRFDDVKFCFELFLTDSIKNIEVNMTKLKGKQIYKDDWKEVTQTDMNEYMGVLIWAGVYRFRNESTSSLPDAESGRTIFRATLSLQKFHMLSQVIHFDNHDTRQTGSDQRDLEQWVERLPLIYNPSPNVTLHSTTATPSPNASLCRIGERDTGGEASSPPARERGDKRKGCICVQQEM